MKLLADENLDAPIVAWLRKLGHDVLFMVEHGPGTSDEEILALAVRDGRIIITQDRDFGELIFRRGLKAAGVLYLRTIGATAQQRLQRFELIWNTVEAELPKRFIVAGRVSLRKRPLN
ncbi:MAG: DUF5615 family PIN-like protein [Planctomycetes bacterium]|nr:DUF5615 family PIN-like protein [Planctomycetota bacterium]